MFVASRYSTTAIAQHEFWLEFSWLDQEYRAAVRRLAQFCRLHQDGSPRGLRRVICRLTPATSAHAAPSAVARPECRSCK
jgi:hypothetical protein